MSFFFKLLLILLINKSLLSNQDTHNSEKLVKLNKEYSDLTPVVNSINKFNLLKKEINNLNFLLKDKDGSIREIAEEEIKEKKIILKQLEEDLLKSLIPKDINDFGSYGNHCDHNHYLEYRE